MNFRQHRTIVSTRFAGSFPPILRFEKLERHPVFLRFSNLALTKNLSANLLVKLCGAAFVQIFPPAQRFRVATNYVLVERFHAFFHRIYQILTNICEIPLVNWWNL